MSSLEDWKAQQKQNDQMYARVYGKCPVCQVKLEKKHIDVSGNVSNHWATEDVCPKCGDKY